MKRLGHYGVWVNTLAVPLLASMTLPPLLLGSLLTVVDPRLGEHLLQIASVPACLCVGLIRWAAAPHRSPLLVMQAEASEVIALYVLCFAFAVGLFAGRRTRGSGS